MPIVYETGNFPREGTLIIHGSHYELGLWAGKTNARRVILLCNVHWPLQLFDTITRLREAGLPEPDLVFRSRGLREQAAMDGIVEPPLIDIDVFRPAMRATGGGFTLGRISRDVLGKHSGDDPSLYRMLANAGCRVRVMGGTCLDEYIGVDRVGIELTEAGSLPAQRFLQELDCFFYRTGTWEEAFGRVMLEAMATGLPVVCHRRGGHTEWIRSGENGFLFDTQEEAFDLLTALRDDPDRRLHIGQAARQTALNMFGEAAREVRRRWYLGIS
ncbi:MAG: glycosyltransferase family 4 protein [Rhodocyclales bacterium]|nr:glycosyltransferase family 4 protein [Rhodocyclales bacterium]